MLTLENQEETEKLCRRYDRFILEGLSEEKAYELAEELIYRDRNGDDRRICFECKFYNGKIKRCALYKDSYKQEYQPMRFLLQRCVGFLKRGAN
jgi:hypothetical protein